MQAALFLIFALFKQICTFNVDVSSGAVGILNINVSGSTGSPIYAGYKLSASIDSQNLRLLAGAPKYDPNPTLPYLTNGSIINCTVDLERFSSSHSHSDNETFSREPLAIQPNCSIFLTNDELALGDNHVAVSDSLGSTFFPVNKTDMAVCTYSRQKKCHTSYFTPGACFTSANASVWEPVMWNEKRCFLHFVDVIYLVDSSNSISASEFNTMKNVMLSVSDVFRNIIGDTTQVGILQYGQLDGRNLTYLSSRPTHYQTPVKLGECRTVQCLKEAITNNMQHLRAPNTYTATAIERAVKIDFPRSRNAAVSEKVIVLITDGVATDYKRLKNSYDLTEANNITVYAIGVGNRVNVGQLKTSANGGVSNDRVLTATKFTQLLNTLDTLTQTISNGVTEGQTMTSAENATENAMFGFSGTTTQDGSAVFGAVGTYQNVGTVVTYPSSDMTNPNMLEFGEVLAALPGLNADTYDAYLGYAITSGRYEGGAKTYIAASAPRYLLLGAVVMFSEASGQKFTIQAHLEDQQHGSYFGGTLLTCDVDNDGKEELLIAAPLYIGENYDEGRVFVYSTRNASSVADWASTTYEPTKLSGNHAPGGRFGAAMTCAGDLDQDGYNDAIIAAPYAEEGRGVVYVYHGSRHGLVDVIAQTISASELSDPGLTNFGLSVEGGIDVDDNKYPDVIVGAPKSDQIVVLRSRPVVSFNSSLSFNKKSLDVVQCLLTPNTSCAVLTACLVYTGKSVEPTQEIEYAIKIDEVSSRVQIKQNLASSQGFTVFKGTMSLTKDTQTCVSLQVFANQNVKEFDSAVMANLTYALPESHTSRPLASVERLYGNTFTTASISLEKSCGADNTCHYDLAVNSDVVVHTTNPSTDNALANGQTLVLTSDELVFVKVNYTNCGEIAYGTRIAVTYTDGFSWTRLQNIASSTSSHSCVGDEIKETAHDGVRTTELTYRHNQYLNDVMLNGSWCYFECVLATNGLTRKADKTSVDIKISTYTYTGFSNDVNSLDNTHNTTFPVKYRSNANTKRVSFEPVVVFNFTEKTETISSVYEIGKETPDIRVEYDVEGKGYSNIPESTVTLTYPRFFNETQRLLYIFSFNCYTASGNAMCTCNQTKVNPLNLSLQRNETSTSKTNFTVIPNPSLLRPMFFDCSDNYSNQSTTCDTVTCHVTDLGPGDVIRFQARFRLWTQTLRLPGNQSVEYRSLLTYDAGKSPQIIDTERNSLPPISSHVIITAVPYSPPVALPKNMTWLIFAAAIAGGTLVMVIIIIVMYKLGFFQSKYADMKVEAQHWQTAGSNGENNPTYDGYTQEAK